VVTVKRIDAIEEFAADLLILKRCPPPETLRALASRFPSDTGLTYCFVLCSVAAALDLEETCPNKNTLPRSHEIYRAASLLSADLFELSLSTTRAATGQDLLRHWAKHPKEQL
jgi:hypothetical protein